MPSRDGSIGKSSQAVVPNMPRRSNNLSIRERRMWQNRLMSAQEAAEKAVEAIEDQIIAAYAAGLSYATVGGILCIHPTTAKDMYDRGIARSSEGGS